MTVTHYLEKKLPLRVQYHATKKENLSEYYPGELSDFRGTAIIVSGFTLPKTSQMK
jgi:hypothetical protein